METVVDIFGSMVFDEAAMREMLPKDAYETMLASIHNGKRLDLETANVVARAMKDWAIGKGATHFTHWFQPMTGITAEKHESFISPSDDGKIIFDFSGKELVRGETDASSFPSGGLRATFEARGYTAWDPTSFAFIKDKTLCIPTAYCSYGGEALDKKTPLLRSMELLSRETVRVLKLFGNTSVKSVKTTVGPEQEYFLIDRDMYFARPDLVYTGRTLFGAPAPKGQELDDHYYGKIMPDVKAFMEELDTELWKLGVLAKTEHNEAAPCQHELAPIFASANIAMDHNQLTMELMQKIARKHGLVCLLHEKPFAGVNGSGKHNNWSISTDAGVNLLEPGDDPFDNAQFLLFLTAVIKAVDEYQDLFRISVATAGNDHRLGSSEAPPAVISVFLGNELSSVLEAIENEDTVSSKSTEMMKIGVHVLPKFPKDTTDRNRTSPFAFTGNKFEFRMLGSANSIAEVNIVLNTAVASVLGEFADILEKADDFGTALHDLIHDTVVAHKRIVFGGNGYDEAWLAEAEKRGLSNLRTTPDALAHYLDEKNVALFVSSGVFSEAELRARKEILEENYVKVLNIEAATMLDMVNGAILPSAARYVRELSEDAMAVHKLSPDAPASFERETALAVSAMIDEVYSASKELAEVKNESNICEPVSNKAFAYKDCVIPAMAKLRSCVDRLESAVAKEYWPYPSYGDILFGR